MKYHLIFAAIWKMFMSNILKVNPKKKVSIKLYSMDKVENFIGENDCKTIQQQVEDSYNKGFTDGRDAAENEFGQRFEVKINENKNQYENILSKINEELESYEKVFEKLVVDTAFVIAEKIVRDKLAERSIINETLTEALRKVLGASKFLVKLNPKDIELINNESKNMMKEAALSKIKYESDDSIDAGGCLIETDIGSADGRISSQLAELKRAFANKLFNENTEDVG